MRFRSATVCALLLLTAALPALAGQDGKKCPYTTQQCLDLMASRMKTGGFVGIELDMDTKSGSPVITAIIPGTSAERAGLRQGDVLYKLNGVVINDKNESSLVKARGEWKAGQEVTYVVQRDGKEQEIKLTLGAMPADVMAKWIGEHMIEHASIEPLTKK